MNVNPYAAPRDESAPVHGVLSGKREDLRAVAKYQKGLLVCILAYFAVIIIQFITPPALLPVLGGVILFAAIAGTVFVFLLAIRVYGTGLGVLFGLLALIPLVGRASAH
jgi:hypothetical protein